MICLNARTGRLRGVNHVLINGEVDLSVFAIWLLWDGGPALIGYYPRTVAGALYMAPDDEVAVAYRFVRSARVVMERGEA